MNHIKCLYCEWTHKDEGVHKNFYQARRHLKEVHPNMFSLLLSKEIEIRNKQSELADSFGWAVTPLKMNVRD